MELIQLFRYAVSKIWFTLSNTNIEWHAENRAAEQWRTQEFCSGGSTNSAENRENGDLGAVAP
jgi:hypothetical protein